MELFSANRRMEKARNLAISCGNHQIRSIPGNKNGFCSYQTQHTILALQMNRHPFWYVIAGEHGHSNTQISVHVIFELKCCSFDDSIPLLFGWAYFSCCSLLLCNGASLKGACTNCGICKQKTWISDHSPSKSQKWVQRLWWIDTSMRFS